MVDDNVLKLIHLLKFGGYEALSGPMARSMARVARTWGLGPGPGDLLVPVPMDAKRLKRRGFNQSEQLARGLAVELGLPVQARSLAKTGSARPQSRTPSERRAANVRNAFTCPPEARGDIAGRRVILVDDLVTTGATAGACLSALLDAGAGSAAVVSFGRAL
jgi:ComF family protein